MKNTNLNNSIPLITQRKITVLLDTDSRGATLLNALVKVIPRSVTLDVKTRSRTYQLPSDSSIENCVVEFNWKRRATIISDDTDLLVVIVGTKYNETYSQDIFAQSYFINKVKCDVLVISISSNLLSNGNYKNLGIYKAVVNTNSLKVDTSKRYFELNDLKRLIVCNIDEVHVSPMENKGVSTLKKSKLLLNLNHLFLNTSEYSEANKASILTCNLDGTLKPVLPRSLNKYPLRNDESHDLYHIKAN